MTEEEKIKLFRDSVNGMEIVLGSKFSDCDDEKTKTILESDQIKMGFMHWYDLQMDKANLLKEQADMIKNQICMVETVLLSGDKCFKVRMNNKDVGMFRICDIIYNILENGERQKWYVIECVSGLSPFNQKYSKIKISEDELKKMINERDDEKGTD